MKMFAVLGALVLGFLAGCAGAPGYHVVKTLPLSGEGGWDYLTTDSAARRLYVTRGTHVMVLDLDTEKVIGDIPDTEGVHGVALAPELGRGFTSNGRANTSTIFDLKTLKLLGQVKTGENPDAILYDPASKRVFTFNGRSHDATAFDAASGTVAGTVPLGGKPEFAVADGKGKVYVNIEDTNEVVAIDSATLAVVKRCSLKPGEEPTGLAIDAKRGRLFAVCHNKLMVIVDAAAMQVIATAPIGERVDGAAFDPGAGLAFASNGEGTVTVVCESAPGTFEVAETVATQRGSRTMALDPKTHKLYLVGAEFLPPPPAPPGAPPRRPRIVKDSFVLIVVGK